MKLRFPVSEISSHGSGRTPEFLSDVRKRAEMEDGYCAIDSEVWHELTRADRARRTTAKKPFGLGDLVASVAQPIARVIDKVAGTNVAGCGGCAQRKAALNKIVPKLPGT